MLTIQCTKKLVDYLNKDIIEKPVETQDKLFSWHAHLFLIQRKKYIIVMNNQSRYNFVIGPIVKKDVKNLDELILNEMKENMRADGIEQSLIDEYMDQAAEITYLKTSERSILGQINDVIFYFECIVEDQESIDVPTINRRLNEFVMLKLPLTYSGRTMINDLKERFSE